ncbi:hypothetical protein CYMTET_27748 [Cymbomonas tetramitiformis]|uniref:Uncharacterized protein n=1 Tax=Cymbomonas tetramitiformis TaxID=36881 RepID=A0AAE0FPQ3_9CHLO|nr:hypothetical protein CYMTET_27748 [Cymbomonas tetramitiformis]
MFQPPLLFRAALPTLQSKLFARDLPSAEAAIKLVGAPEGDIMMERVIELASLLSGRGRYCTLLDEDCVIQGRIIEDTLTLTDLIGERALWFTSGVKLQ